MSSNVKTYTHRIRVFYEDSGEDAIEFAYLTNLGIMTFINGTVEAYTPLVDFEKWCISFGRPILLDTWKYVWSLEKYEGHTPIPIESFMDEMWISHSIPLGEKYASNTGKGWITDPVVVNEYSDQDTSVDINIAESVYSTDVDETVGVPMEHQPSVEDETDVGVIYNDSLVGFTDGELNLLIDPKGKYKEYVSNVDIDQLRAEGRGCLPTIRHRVTCRRGRERQVARAIPGPRTGFAPPGSWRHKALDCRVRKSASIKSGNSVASVDSVLSEQWLDSG